MRRLFRWLWRLLARPRAAPRPARQPPPRRIGFEGLEDRRMFSVTAAPLPPPRGPGPAGALALPLPFPNALSIQVRAGRAASALAFSPPAAEQIPLGAAAVAGGKAAAYGPGSASGSNETSTNQAGTGDSSGVGPGSSPAPAGNQPGGAGTGPEQTNAGTVPTASPAGYGAWAEPRREETSPENGVSLFLRPADGGRPEALPGETPGQATVVIVPGAGRLSDGGGQPPRGRTGGEVAADISRARLRAQAVSGPGLAVDGTTLFSLPPAGDQGPAGEWLLSLLTGHALNPLPAVQGRGAPAQAGTPQAAGTGATARRWVGADLGQILAQAFYLANLKQAGANPGPQGGLLQTPGDAQLLVADLVQRSTEAFTRLVQAFYTHFLGRAAAAGEASGWVAMLLNGQTEEQVLSAFLSTAEFYTRTGALVPAGTGDERFIRALYDVLLQRPATDAEVSGWLGALPGLGRGGVASALLASVEYRSRRVEALYHDLLGRPAAPAEVASWAGSPFDLLTIRLLFENHPEMVTAPGPR